MIKDLVNQENLKMSNAVSTAKGYIATHKNVIGGKPPVSLILGGKTTQNGTPAPDNKVDIVGAGESGSLSVKSTGKNLFDGIWDDTISKNKIAVKAGFSYIYSESSTATAVNVYFYEDESSNTHLKVKYVGAGNAYIPTQDGFIKLDKSTTTKTECMLEIGSNITAYEPYTETTADIPLSSPLYEKDYIRYNMDGSGE